jgi:uncharacterized membrane protein YdbT with pleckstrin-like domain
VGMNKRVDKDSILEKKINLEDNQKNILENTKGILYEARPGISFLLKPFNLFLLIFLSILIVTIPLFIIYIIFQIILWRNIKYYFYEDRFVELSGIINIKKKEIYFKNIKHIKMTRNLLFQKFFLEGTIHIYTPGSSFVDNTIISIKNSEEIYEDFKRVIE